MKILLISHFLPYPPHGGNFQRNYNLLKEASKRHEIYFLSFYQKQFHANQAELDSCIDSLKPFCKEIKVFDIPSEGSTFKFYSLLFANLFSKLPYTVSRFFSSKMKQAVRQIVDKVDIVQMDTISLAQYSELCPVNAVSTSLNHHNVESDLLKQRGQSETNFLKGIYYRWQAEKLRKYEDSIMQDMSLNITVTEEDRQRFIDRGCSSEFKVIANGTDTNYFKPDSTSDLPDEKSLMFAGTLDWYPNEEGVIYFLESIFPLILADLPKTRFNLYGRNPSQNLLSLCKKEKQVTAHGFVEDIRKHMKKSAIYVVPLRVGGGSRLKILDAMASGKAIVSSSLGAEGLEVVSGKDILIADTPEEFSDAVSFLVKNPKNREALAVNARQTVENKYSWQKIAPKLEAAWEKLV